MRRAGSISEATVRMLQQGMEGASTGMLLPPVKMKSKGRPRAYEPPEWACSSSSLASATARGECICFTEKPIARRMHKIATTT